MSGLASVAMFAILLLCLGGFVTMYAIRGVELLRRRGQNTPRNESILKCGSLAVPFLLAAFVWTRVLFLGDGSASIYSTLAYLTLTQLFVSVVPGCALAHVLRSKAPMLASLAAGAAATVTIWIPFAALSMFGHVFRLNRVGAENAVFLLIILLLCMAIVVWHVVFWRLMRKWDIDNPTPADHRSCVACGYSLQGIPGRICPECGRRSADDM